VAYWRQSSFWRESPAFFVLQRAFSEDLSLRLFEPDIIEDFRFIGGILRRPTIGPLERVNLSPRMFRCGACRLGNRLDAVPPVLRVMPYFIARHGNKIQTDVPVPVSAYQ